ncbi:MAG: hypothetical protein ACYDH1_19120, partial [Anaerolineaceae bacterium]
MIDNDIKHHPKHTWEQFAPMIGVVLVVTGLLFLLDQRIKTNWLSLALPVFISLILLAWGIISKRRLLMIPGFIMFGLSAAFFILFQRIVNYKTFTLLFAAIGIFSFSWLLLFVTLAVIRKSLAWWALFVATISGAVSINFFIQKPTLLTFVLTISLAVGIVFVLWGTRKRQIGLLIPGFIISTSGAGVYFAWNDQVVSNGLQQTGTMLVWFALGWILITVISKIFSRKFTWWPLIPGGVLPMVGAGLYIGGNPANALGFFQNTGSIGLIMFGVYLILLKYGM